MAADFSSSQFPALQARVPSNWVKSRLDTKRRDTVGSKGLECLAQDVGPDPESRSH